MRLMLRPMKPIRLYWLIRLRPMMPTRPKPPRPTRLTRPKPLMPTRAMSVMCLARLMWWPTWSTCLRPSRLKPLMWLITPRTKPKPLMPRLMRPKAMVRPKAKLWIVAIEF
jgi:hypothetical protein